MIIFLKKGKKNVFSKYRDRDNKFFRNDSNWESSCPEFQSFIPALSTQRPPHSQQGSPSGREASIIGRSDPNPLGLNDSTVYVQIPVRKKNEEDNKKNKLINTILDNKNRILSRNEAEKILNEIEKDLIKYNHFKKQGSQGISLEEAVEKIYGHSDLDNIYTLPNTAPEETWDHIETVLKNCENSKSEDFSETLKSDDFSQKILDLVNSLNQRISPEEREKWKRKLAENFINKKTNDPNVRFFDATPEYDKHCGEIAIGVTLLERYQEIVSQSDIQTSARDKVETFLKTRSFR